MQAHTRVPRSPAGDPVHTLGEPPILLARLRAAARRFLSRRYLPGHDADDLVQAAWVALLANDRRKLRMWDPARGLDYERFVLFLAEREFASIHAQSRRRRGKVQMVEPGAALEELSVERTTPESQAIAGAELQRWLESIAKLPERGRDVFNLLWVVQLSPEQAACALGTARQVIYNWQFRLRGLARRSDEPTSEREGKVEPRSLRARKELGSATRSNAYGIDG